MSQVKGLLLPVLSLTVLLLAGLPLTAGQGGQQQYINFYSQKNCSSNYLLGTVRATGTLNGTLQNASSLYVNGLWRLEGSSQVVSLDRGCISLNGTNGTYRQVTRYGNENQNGVEFFLYVTQNFGGIPYQVYRNGTNLAGSVGINSWYFTGNNSWTTYSGRNYTGNSTCLKPSGQVVTRAYGFTYSLNGSITVGSVKYGCGGGQSSSSGRNFQEIFLIWTTTILMGVLAAFIH